MKWGKGSAFSGKRRMLDVNEKTRRNDDGLLMKQ